MKKFLLMFLLYIMLVPSVFAEDFPAKGGRDEYPIYWYLHRHGERLMKVLNTKKFFRLHGWSCNYLVKIKRNGDIIPLKVYISQNKYYDNQVKKILESTNAEPFGDEIDLDEMIVEIVLSFADWGDTVSIWYGPNNIVNDKVYTIFVQTTK